MYKNLKKIIIGSIILFATGAAHAATGWNVSLLGGSGSATSNGSGSWTATGVSFGYVLSNNIELGAEYDSMNNVGYLSVEANYLLTESFYIGLQYGSTQSGTLNTLIGPQIGYDYKLTSNISVGPEVEYLSSMSSGQTSYLIALVNLKYTF